LILKIETLKESRGILFFSKLTMTLLGSTVFSATGLITFSANEFDRKKDKMIANR